MASGGTNLYFIALLPDQIIQDEVTAFKQEAQARFGSGHALRSPPHITLVPPFRSHLSDFSALQASADEQEPFSVQLRDFERFGNRVIFVNVVPEPALLTCQAQIADFCHQQFGISPDPRPFHPHMTVAFKDLERAVFPNAWAYFSAQAYERMFTADAFTLLMHTGQQWEIKHRFAFR
ncbi:2'-5' RNA ligase family protein [Spirosoma taeanense]|uniref:2'-5' RNA ligase family protein n=1 Tax=Spirosoma taeanense TaxID=2735870 RepID=A0A6M5Y5I2_9BACT|nr:2'-5' RNA ligase family protein [Spirosoma taeanense]QJW88471.1 2'-5' RNA ligase family protein [Spirosoma taeanense]